MNGVAQCDQRYEIRARLLSPSSSHMQVRSKTCRLPFASLNYLLARTSRTVTQEQRSQQLHSVRPTQTCRTPKTEKPAAQERKSQSVTCKTCQQHGWLLLAKPFDSLGRGVLWLTESGGELLAMLQSMSVDPDTQ